MPLEKAGWLPLKKIDPLISEKRRFEKKNFSFPKPAQTKLLIFQKKPFCLFQRHKFTHFRMLLELIGLLKKKHLITIVHSFKGDDALVNDLDPKNFAFLRDDAKQFQLCPAGCFVCLPFWGGTRCFCRRRENLSAYQVFHRRPSLTLSESWQAMQF